MTISQRADVIEFAPSNDTKIASGTMALTFSARLNKWYLRAGFKGRFDVLGWRKPLSPATSATAYSMSASRMATVARCSRFRDIEANKDYDLQVGFGDGSVSVWLDGVSVGTKAFNTSWLTNNEYLQIGANGWSSKTGESGFTQVFDGTISNFILAEGHHSPTELANLVTGAR